MRINTIPDKLLERFEYRDGDLYYVDGRKKGKVAGFKHSCRTCDYWCIKYKRKRYQAHRVIWTMFNDNIPEGLQIDHINGDSLDNRIENLRPVTASENQKNTKLYVTNKTGITGVNWSDNRQQFQVRIHRQDNGKASHIGWFKDFFSMLCTQECRESRWELYRTKR